MTIEVVTPPIYEPVSREEAKDWMGVDSGDTAHDATVDMLIKAMREYAETLTMRSFIQRTLRLYLHEWPYCGGLFGTEIELPTAPLASVSSVKYKDLDGTLQTLNPSLYVAHSWREPAIIVPEWNVIWPVIRRVPDAVQVTFVAGYPSGSPDDAAGARTFLPASLLLWMKARAATLFKNREQIITGTIVSELPRDYVDGLLDSLVLGRRLF